MSGAWFDVYFYAVLEECMPVEENLRKILMMLEELEQQSLQVKLLIYFIWAEGKFKFVELKMK